MSSNLTYVFQICAGYCCKLTSTMTIPLPKMWILPTQGLMTSTWILPLRGSCSFLYTESHKKIGHGIMIIEPHYGLWIEQDVQVQAMSSLSIKINQLKNLNFQSVDILREIWKSQKEDPQRSLG